MDYQLGNRMLAYANRIMIWNVIAFFAVFLPCKVFMLGDDRAITVGLLAAAISSLVTAVGNAETIIDSRGYLDKIMHSMCVANLLGIIALILLSWLYLPNLRHDTADTVGVWGMVTVIGYLVLVLSLGSAKMAKKHGAWEPVLLLAVYSAPIISTALGPVLKKRLLSYSRFT